MAFDKTPYLAIYTYLVQFYFKVMKAIPKIDKVSPGYRGLLPVTNETYDGKTESLVSLKYHNESL